MNNRLLLVWPVLGAGAGALTLALQGPAWLALILAVVVGAHPLARSALAAPHTQPPLRTSRHMLDSLPDAAGIYDEAGSLLAANARFQGEADRLEPTPWQALDGDTLQLRDETTGRTRWLRVHRRALNGDTGRTLICLQDISALREYEHRLHTLQARQQATAQAHDAFVRRLIDVIPEPVYIKDEHGAYVMVNEAFARQRGQPREEIEWKTAYDLAPDWPTAEEIAAEDARVLAGEYVYKEDDAPYPATGEARIRIVSKGRCINAEGQALVVGANFDITEERQSKRALAERLAQEQAHHQRTAEFIQRIMNLVPFPLYVKDAQSRYLLVNDAMERDCAIPRSQLIGSTGLPADTPPSELYRVFEEDGAVLGGLRVYHEEQGVHPLTGRRFWRILSKDMGHNPDGEQVIVGAHIDLTELRSAEQEAREALNREIQLRTRTQEFLQRLIDIIPDPVYIKKSGGRYVLINQAFATWHGQEIADVLAQQGPLNTSPSHANMLSLAEDQCVLTGEEIHKEEHGHNRLTGEEVFRLVTKRPSIYFDGEPVVVGIDHHITRWRIAERESQAALAREVALRQRTQDFLSRLIDVIPDPFYIKKSGGRYVMVNQAFAEYYGLSQEEIIRQDGPLPNSPEETNRRSISEDEHILLSGEDLCFEEHTTRRLTGEEVFRIISKRRSIYLDGEPVVVGFHHHVTRWRQLERELTRLATEDTLTGIANRRRFTEEATRQLALAQRSHQPLSLLIFDLDHFKCINDAYGHQAGDTVLVETVRRALQVLRQSDLAGRWGGEEFVVLLPDSSLADAIQAAERLRMLLESSPVTHGAVQIPVTLSGGVAQLLTQEALEQLVGRADKALYQAKQEGRNRIVAAT